jgi:hypothetical protein
MLLTLNITAAETKPPAALDEAVKFLSEMLAKEPVLKTEIEEAAAANGCCEIVSMEFGCCGRTKPRPTCGR